MAFFDQNVILFDEGRVLHDVQTNPPPPRLIWEFKDFLDQNLATLVLAEFARYRLDFRVLEGTVDRARSIVYDECCQMLKGAIGLPYAQWHALDRACQQAGLHGFRTFAGLSPPMLRGPPDLAYTARYLGFMAPFTAARLANNMQLGPSIAAAAPRAAPHVAPPPPPPQAAPPRAAPPHAADRAAAVDSKPVVQHGVAQDAATDRSGEFASSSNARSHHSRRSGAARAPRRGAPRRGFAQPWASGSNGSSHLRGRGPRNSR